MFGRCLSVYAVRFILAAIAIGWLPLRAEALERIALVIGNDTYARQGDLNNAANDARLIASTLEGIGFTLYGGKAWTDLERADILELMDGFGRAAKGKLALAYVAAHGAEYRGENYFLPSDDDHIRVRENLPDWALSLETLLTEMALADTSVVLLDICRTLNLPYRDGSRTTARGLAKLPEKPPQSIVLFAAQSGQVAYDGEGDHGPFATALGEVLSSSDAEISLMMRGVRSRVMDLTKDRKEGRQSPEIYVNLDDRPIYLASVVPPQPPLAPSTGDATLVAMVAPPNPTPNPPGSMIVLEGRYPDPGSVFQDCADCPEMIVVPAGKFLMGSSSDEAGRNDDEGPQHWVTISKPFAVGRFEVTQAEWQALMGSNPSTFKGSRNPVDSVTWDDAQAFIERLNAKSFAFSGVSGGGTKGRYRLLSEAEWEYAARAGTETAYPWGNTIGKGNANCGSCGSKWDDKQTAPVGSFQPNGYGLYDMHGNVMEWVEDCWSPSNKSVSGDVWVGIHGKCRYRVLRGGSWVNFPRTLRSASRFDVFASDARSNNYGIRVARTVLP